ncbi:toxin [Intrasporangium chromatireducens Q5-1]|uniref:Toxin n=1 Tax=Intrasporangium chromatireducens Q5-1 TaxID=584657 RepID=W9GLX0_9MICO|nr:toxin [Intrasporangium chromatireducens Q5-1]
MKVHRSALKHGVLPEDAVQAADLSLWIEPLADEDWPHRELRLGFDTQARMPHIVCQATTDARAKWSEGMGFFSSQVMAMGFSPRCSW